MSEPSIAVIGGGIQGVCSALALAHAGARVTILEAADALLDRASFRSEGKIHLGFVYANDATGRTAELMLDSALRFGPLLEQWIGAVDWDRLRSSPFSYAMMPDSLLSEPELRAHYARIDHLYRERYRTNGLHYLGLRPESLLSTAASGAGAWLERGKVIEETLEYAVDRSRFRAMMTDAVAANPRITVKTRQRVEAVDRTPNGFCIAAAGPDGTVTQHRSDLVVNCSWTDRLRLDRHVGIEPGPGWSYRLKFRLTGCLAGRMVPPSYTFVLGPYGDFVRYQDGSVYVSWYPVCLRGWSDELTPPAGWGPACRSGLPSEEAEALSAAVLREFGAIMPVLRDFRVDDVGAGVIFAWGTRDIDDPGSELHQRWQIGVGGGAGYYTVNTGKFTCAPLFAEQLTARIRNEAGLA